MENSEAQKRAIEHNDGPMIVLAGPGSGKTTVITQRTKYLIEQCGINPYNILVITFTKASAEEMKERFINLVGNMGKAVNFGTFHAIFYTILKHAYNYSASNIIRPEIKQQYLREIVEEYKIDTEDEKELISSIESEISIVKGEMMSLDNYYSTSCSEETFRSIYNDYQKKLKDSKLIDFDDMILQCYMLLIQRNDILQAWQEKFEYILVDEFQDINKMQYEIVKLLAKPHNNLFIVGDDDQSIYRFRGAKPEIMLNFEKDYSNAKRVILNINYRSTKCIVESACKVVKNNKNRYQKDIITVNEEGEPVRIAEFKSENDENKKIVGEIFEYVKSGIKLSEIAILYRTNTQPRAIIEKFMEYDIPFTIKDSVPSIYDHWLAKNMFSYIESAKSFIDNQKKSVSRRLLLQIIGKPNRYISRDNIVKASDEENCVNVIKLKNLYLDKDWMIQRIDKLEYDLDIISKSKPSDAINYIRNGIGYDEYLEEYAKARNINKDELFDKLDELQESASKHETYGEWRLHIDEYNEKLREQVKQRKNNIDSVNMTTFHGSKGLEFDVVFIIDANEGITPHKKALLEVDLEEERRMFYVAMTRARKRLHVYYVKQRYKKEIEISRFVGEIFIDKTELVTGTKIVHKRYGEGTILKNEDNKITVKFVKISVSKILDIDFCVGNRIIELKSNK